MAEKFNILIVEDEKLIGDAIYNHLKTEGFQTVLFSNAEEALVHFQQNSIDLAVLDYKLPGMSGEDLFKKIRALDPFLPLIFMTSFSSIDQAVRLLQMGAFSYIAKPVRLAELCCQVKNALEKVKLRREVQDLEAKIDIKYHIENYVFNSERMQLILKRVLKIADSYANVLITGESGTGKEVIASIIHGHSKRKSQKLVTACLSALPENLMDVELFGAKKGAYTNSVEHRVGKFEEADKGTIFLDEIGELPLNMQVKLLRVIQEKRITRVGTNKPIAVDFRLITASNKNLNELVKAKKFREDLYYRLNVIQIELPPLRERKEEIPFLVDLFVKKYSQREGKKIEHISKDVLNLLRKYQYPGNVRELENIMESAVVLSNEGVIRVEDLPIHMREQNGSFYDLRVGDERLTLSEAVNLVEKQIIQKALAKHKFNQSKAAKELGISKTNIQYKMKKLNIGL